MKTNASPIVYAAPILIDLNGDGVQYTSLDAGLRYDFAGDGFAEQTAWVGAQDGLLSQMNADGSLKIVFSTAANETDMEGLAKVYDTNQDLAFTVADKDFASFGIWQDKDGDAVFDTGEFVSLEEAGIAAITLSTDGRTLLAADGDVTVFGTGSYVRTDGTTGELTDVAFKTDDAAASAPITQDQTDADYADMDLSALRAPVGGGVEPIDIVWQAGSADLQGWTGEVLAVDRFDAPSSLGEPGGWAVFVDYGSGFTEHVPTMAEHEANQMLLDNAAEVRLDFVSASGEHQEILASDVSRIVWGGQ